MILGSTIICDGKDNDCDGQIDNRCGFFWAVSSGGTGHGYVRSITMDSAGNLYITGNYGGTAVFGNTTLSSQGNWDVFVVKLSNQGTFLWAVSSGGTEYDFVASIATDSADNLYITGNYGGTAVFGSITLSSQGNTPMYVAKLSNQGKFLWAVSSGGTGDARNIGITTDSAGNLYITGAYYKTVEFGSTTLSSQEIWPVFVAKLSNQGKFLWAVSAGRLSYNGKNSIVTDSAGNLYITGHYGGIAGFGSIALSSQGGWKVFVAKLSNQGKFLWAVSSGGTDDNFTSSIATDSAGNLYITGDYERTAVFGSTTLSSQNRDVYVAKLSNQGKFLWAVSAGGTEYDFVGSIATDSAGNLYITGSYGGTAVFGSITLSLKGNYHMLFVAKLSNQGKFLWVVSADGTGGSGADSIVTDSTGNLYITGTYFGTVEFGSITLSSQGNKDVYVAKLQ